MSLTPKREAFAQAVASGKSQADAYRAAYNCSPSAKPKTVQESASRLMADPKVAARVAEIRAPIVERAGITLDGHLKDLMELREAAKAAGQFSPAISAEIARGKAAGLYTDKVEHSGPDGQPLAPPVLRVVIDGDRQDAAAPPEAG
jgi:phage terminase small subunit